MRVTDLEGIRIKLASPDDILSWSHGEVTKPETINYRTQKAERDGLFCERIFGPEKDYECYCGKYRRIRYKGIICDRCGVEVTKSSVRRERMGHIKLATPVSHIWFLRGVPSRIGMVLNIPMQQLEKVIYFAAYVITKVDEEAKKRIMEEIDKEFNMKKKAKTAELKENEKELDSAIEELREAKDRAKEEISSIETLKILSEVEYYDYSLKYGEIFEAGTGAEALRKIFEKADLKKLIEAVKIEEEKASAIAKKKILRRLRLLEGMQKSGIRPEWMFITIIPVLPPDLRPMVQLDGGRFASSDLNDLYRRVINRNNRLKYLLEISAPEVIVRNEKRMLQEAVDALIDNGMRKGILTTATTGGRRLLKSLADMLKGKQGRFRQNLLGKRVDYSGRSVIVVGPKLRLHQCGLPKKMALELFKPFVIQKLLEKELAYNVRGASRLIEQGIDEVWAILEDVVRGKAVLLNRAPTLHRLGIQAFQPVLIEGESIKLHPLVCKAFNADFDGDQMAVHVPLSEEAQKEAKELMLSSNNLLKPATGTPIVSPTQDIILGCYWLTRLSNEAEEAGKTFSSPAEAIIAHENGALDLRVKIKVRMKDGQILETSAGRLLFNETLPEGFRYINDLMKSKKLEKIMSEIILKYPKEVVEETLDRVKNLGFEFATVSGVSWGMADLIVPPQKEEIINKAQKEIETIESHFKKGLLSREEKGGKVIEVWTKVKSEIEKLIPETLPKFGSIFTIIDSGARGSWSQPVQMAGMKGLVINPAGQIIELPVKSSFKEGFDVLEYFISTHGARKGTADTALRTSTAGYLTRRLVDVAHDVIIQEEDCGDKEGFEVLRSDADELGQDFSFKIVGKVLAEDIEIDADTKLKKGDIVDWEKAEKIIEKNIKSVKSRSPITCKSKRGICQKCYGWNLGRNKKIDLGEAVGVVAAQAIGEPGTQLTMRTFHTGGVAGGSDITLGLPRVQEIFEARVPGGRAEISKVDGKVIDITPERVIKIKAKDLPEEEKEKPAPAKKKKGSGATKEDVVEYKIPEKTAIYVEKGQQVKKGQQLCEGNLDLKELFKAKGQEEVQRYVLKEIQRIYVSQGAVIHDKHIEIIVRQMFSRVKVKDPGDSIFSMGEVVEKTRVSEENEILKKEKKNLIKAVPMLLGISRVALTTDSFLSAASFQETSRVLIKSSLEGKEDRLKGLKENVIIGKLIPAGTGFHK
ncbi:MAG: DNA-directed RNA polymerase subunit beta' [bacterium]|nr:DNA-directed RNA polymerase subunit beta' [bacterium]